jgi:hypothetical protein
MPRLRLIVVLILICAARTWAASPILGPVINPANSHEYFLLSIDTWTASESAAQGLNGHLVTINDAAEQTWVYSTFGAPSGSDRSLWTGLNDAATEGTKVWASGELSTYTNWYDASNGVTPATDDYVFMLLSQGIQSQGGKWLITADHGYFTNPHVYGVVERVVGAPEPSGIVFIGLLGLLLLRRCGRHAAQDPVIADVGLKEVEL